MSKTAIKLALRELLGIRPLSKARGKSAASDRPAASWVKKLVRLTAAFCEAIDREGAGKTLRARADLIKHETASGTRYDEYRRKFIALFNKDEMNQIGLAPLPEDFGTFVNQFGGSNFLFPAHLQYVQEISAECKTFVMHLKATKEYRPSPAPGLTPWALEPLSKDAVPSPARSEDPYRVASVWIQHLQRLELLAERGNFWGNQLILYCRDVRDPNQYTSDLPVCLKGQEEQFDDALAAIQKAAVDLAAEKVGGEPEQPAATASGEKAASPDAALPALEGPLTGAERDKALQSLEPASRKAYLSFQYAQSKEGRQLEDKEAHDLLHEMGISTDQGDLGELIDYELPSFDTWSRQLREARSALGEQKHQRRGRPPKTRSIVKASQIEPQKKKDDSE